MVSIVSISGRRHLGDTDTQTPTETHREIWLPPRPAPAPSLISAWVGWHFRLRWSPLGRLSSPRDALFTSAVFRGISQWRFRYLRVVQILAPPSCRVDVAFFLLTRRGAVQQPLSDAWICGIIVC